MLLRQLERPPDGPCTNFKASESMSVDWRSFIEERKEVMLGKPVFKATRITVQHVLEELGGGMSFDDLLDNYPTLKPEHIRAALQYAVVDMHQRIYD
jgi:uncharacterized protein (DUF433 family)